MDIFEISQYFDINIVVIILGLVQYSRKLGLKGNRLLVVSMSIGIIIGSGSCIANLGIPSTFADIFLISICGLVHGLAASGVYDIFKFMRNGHEIEKLIEDNKITDG